MRKSSLFFACIGIQAVILGLVFAHATYKEEASVTLLREKMRIVETLALTDLCLFSEASYTRHLSQADLHTAFQDSPMALEHFPSGSLVAPPVRAKKIYERAD